MHSPDQPSELPTGPVTFLFTEIEGSTRLLDELGDDYAGLLVTRAGHLWATVESMEQRRGMRILPFERERSERVLAGHLSDPDFRAASESGRTLAQEDAVHEASPGSDRLAAIVASLTP